MTYIIKTPILIYLVIVFSLLGACESWLPSAYRQDITQGNAIKRKALDKIDIGMNKADITRILGSPMVLDPFHAGRWDYIYRFIPGRGKTVQSRVTLYFEDDVLVKIDDSEYVEPPPDVHNKSGKVNAISPAGGGGGHGH